MGFGETWRQSTRYTPSYQLSVRLVRSRTVKCPKWEKEESRNQSTDSKVPDSQNGI